MPNDTLKKERYEREDSIQSSRYDFRRNELSLCLAPPVYQSTVFYAFTKCTSSKRFVSSLKCASSLTAQDVETRRYVCAQVFFCTIYEINVFYT